ncbi:MAG: hypothetical protein ACRDPC_09050 [Solirubrobacteraceae bacterium]
MSVRGPLGFPFARATTAAAIAEDGSEAVVAAFHAIRYSGLSEFHRPTRLRLAWKEQCAVGAASWAGMAGGHRTGVVEAGVGVLDRVMERSGGDHLVVVALSAEQRGDLPDRFRRPRNTRVTWRLR